MKFKQETKEKVFQPGYGLPTMTLDEYATFAEQMFGEMERNQKEAEAKRKKEEEENDPDKDDLVDQETMKAREWDDYTDEHHKGEGNTGWVGL